jgi:hypothetical protein
MRSMNCRDVRREIEEAGSLSAAELSHLETCAACEKLSRQQAKLQAIISSLGTVEAPGDFDFRLRARLAGEARRNGRSFLLKDFSFGYRSAAVAAMLLLIGSALGVVIFRARPDQAVATSQPAPASTGVPSAVKPGPAVAVKPAGEEAVAGTASVGPTVHTRRSPKGRSLSGAVASSRPVNGLGTRDQSSTSARVLRPNDALPQSYPTSAFPINASYQSLKVELDDGKGASRTISLPTVSFGSQLALSQSASPLMASARGTW